MTHLATLVCWSCGKRIAVKMPEVPQFSFEVAGAANDVGWIGLIDFENSRSLVFCSKKCVKNQTTGGGRIRKRPKKVHQHQPQSDPDNRGEEVNEP